MDVEAHGRRAGRKRSKAACFPYRTLRPILGFLRQRSEIEPLACRPGKTGIGLSRVSLSFGSRTVGVCGSTERTSTERLRVGRSGRPEKTDTGSNVISI